ncbi:MAG: hypothetical protein OEO79_10180 [Gemmatimonadota bacterium]|nr:hypothetical protein [Gemmatimonadota bacterium]
MTWPSTRIWLLVGLCALSSACASGAPPSAGPAAPAIAPANRGFDGGTQVRGGFTNVVSSVRDSVVDAPRARVWAALPSVFETLGIETPTVDPASFTMGDPGSRVARIGGSTRLSTYLDCGIGILGPNADRYEVTLQLMVQLANNPAGGTLVRTTLDAYARPRDTSGDALQCASQRTLERQIVDLIDIELSGGVAPAAGASTLVNQGRIPVAGDRVRIECRIPRAQLLAIGEGFFMGAGEGELLLDVGIATGSVAVPVENVGRVQVQDRGSASRLVGFVGAVLGIAGGAYHGRTWYDRDAKVHFPQGVYMTGGALAGGIAGYLLGRIAGSFVGTTVWVDAPTGWARGYSASTVAPIVGGAVGPALPMACPSFESDG